MISETQFDKSHIGQLIRDREFEMALAFLQMGACDNLSREEWIDQDMARARVPITLILDRQYTRALKDPHPLEEKVIEALIKAGCPVDAVDDYGQCPLGYAAGADARDIARSLVKAGADINAPGCSWPPLLCALSSQAEGGAALAWDLMEAGASLDERSIDQDGEERLSVRELIQQLSASGDPTESEKTILVFEEFDALRKSLKKPATMAMAKPSRL